jgi:hypothetical protein
VKAASREMTPKALSDARAGDGRPKIPASGRRWGGDGRLKLPLCQLGFPAIDDIKARRTWSQFGARNTFGEIAQVARGEFERPTTFVCILYCLRGLYCGSAVGDGLL